MHGHVSISRQIFIWVSRRYLWEKMFLLTLPPSDWPLFTQAMPSFPAHHAELLLEMGLCYMAPGGACSRGWRPSRAGPFSHGQLLRSRRVSEGKTWTWNDPSKQSPPWVHPQAKAPVPLTLKFSCSSFFLDLFFQLDQYIFQRGITPPPSSPASILTSSHTITTAPAPNSTLLETLTFFTPLALQKVKAFYVYSPPYVSSSLHIHAKIGRVYWAITK